ncbi:MAG TPA: hypothetical protein VIT88_09245 [Pyrinomonadaceae bacterium]
MVRWLLTLLCLTTFSVYAQTPAPVSKQQRPGKGPAKEADPETAQKRSIALSMLSSLAVEARSYRDEPLRARVQARVADVLWDHDQEAARSLFTRAWDTADAIDLHEPVSRSVSLRSNLRPTLSVGLVKTNLLAEILRLASARDYKFGEVLLAKLTKSADGDHRPAGKDSPPRPADQELRERLRLASEFIENGNVQRALQFADPALTQITTASIQFLVALRDKDQRQADQRFARLLFIAAEDPKSDANTVSLLTSYAFTPSVYLQVSEMGIPSVISYDRGPAPPLEASLRSNFFRVSANILLRPLDQLDRSSAGRPGTYLVARRLFPLFHQYAPDLAATISAHLAAMGPEAAEATVRAGDRLLNRGFNSSGEADSRTTGEVESDLKDLLERARNSDERDRAYGFAAMQLARAGDAHAYDFVDKVEDTETRKSVKRITDYGYLMGLLEKKKTDELIARVTESGLNSTLRAHFLVRAAELLEKTDRVRAMEVLDKASEEAKRINAATPERAYVFVSLLAAYTKLDRARVSDLARESIKAANNVADFTGENGQYNWMIEGKFSARLGTALAGPTDLPDAFAIMTADDFYQAVDLSRTFKGDAPRALATLAIARAVLEDRNK